MSERESETVSVEGGERDRQTERERGRQTYRERRLCVCEREIE